MNISAQIDAGIIVCPATHQRLRISNDGAWLVTEDGNFRYQLLGGNTPVLLTNPGAINQYAASSHKMNDEYSAKFIGKRNSPWLRIKRLLDSDHRTADCTKGFDRAVQMLSDNSLCLSIGGGPSRAHPKLININIGAFPNVDIVADAHQLPYANDSVDFIFCEAVIEHLHTPHKAVSEMYRVLKPGGKVFACTPFLFPYHGYPHHYQNFTLSGHTHLFEMSGLKVMNSGACVGPVYTVTHIIHVFIREYSPAIIRLPLRLLWSGITILVRPLDRIVGKRPNAHILASTTYLLATK